MDRLSVRKKIRFLYRQHVFRLVYKFNTLIEQIKITEHILMITAALIIGTAAGYSTILFRFMIKTVSDFCFPGEGSLLTNIINAPWEIKLLAPFLGGLIVGPIVYFFAPEAKRSGVPEVMQSVILKGGAIRPRVALAKALTASITIGSGGSVGREGPIVHIGSSIGSTLGQLLRVSDMRIKTFVGCGAAAGIAAAFNAPIAGTLFAVEIILRDFALSQFSPIVIASVIATVISHHYHGNFAEFQLPAYQLVSPYELFFYLGLALVMALVGFVFIKILYFSEDYFEKIIAIPEYLKPALGGFLVGLIALVFPEVMGVGYNSINNALVGQMLWSHALLLVLAKILATAMTLGSGGSGGVFAPSLFLGAVSGSAFGILVSSLFPEISSSPGAYALVAMGGLVSATTHAPITAILMIFELTNNYQIILPLMVTCIASTLFSSLLCRESIYTLRLFKRNILIKEGHEVNIMRSIFVRDVYSANVEPLAPNARFDEVISRIISGQEPYFPVTGKNQRLLGIISMHDIKAYIYDRDLLQHLLIASDLATQNYPAVLPDDNCQSVLDIIGKQNLEGLAVIDNEKNKRFLGMVWRKDILNAYNKEIERREITYSFASQLAKNRENESVHFIEGYSLAEIAVPKAFVGKSIIKLNIRAKYGVDILLIRKMQKNSSQLKPVPNAQYIFAANDRIVVSGDIGRINLLKNLR